MKNSTTEKAGIAPVELGSRVVIQGLMSEAGIYYVGVPQICDLFADDDTFKTHSNYAAQALNRLMGKDFKTHRFKTEFNRNVTTAVTLTDFEKILRKLDRLGNKAAQSMVDDLVGLSLHQLFSDAFEVEFDKRDRKEWLKARQASKEAFWSLGDAIAEYKDRHPERSDKFPQYAFSNCQDALNRGLFGKEASTIRSELGVKNLLRDHYGQIALRRIDLVQAVAAANIVNSGTNPLDAVKSALAMFNFEVVDYLD